MQIKSINNINFNNRIFRNSKTKEIKNPLETNNDYIYSKDRIKNLSKNYDIDDYSLYLYDFEIINKNKTSLLEVKNRKIEGHIKNNDIDLKIKHRAYTNKDFYSGFINNTPVQFECETTKKGWEDYSLKFTNTENIDKELIEMLAVQKGKRLDDLLFATANVRI